jgi:hypothetical protein
VRNTNQVRPTQLDDFGQRLFKNGDFQKKGADKLIDDLMVFGNIFKPYAVSRV